MKILIINIYFHPDPTGTGLVITELARALAAQGHDVTVITSVPHYGVTGDRRQDGQRQSPPPKAPLSPLSPVACRLSSASLSPLWRQEIMDGIRVIRTAVYIPRRKTFWARALNYVTFSALAMIAGFRSGKQDLIMCTSPPLLLGASIGSFSWLRGVPFVFNVQDIYPDAAVLMGILRNPALIALSRRLERFVYWRAALVTVISGTAKQNLQDKGVPEAKIAVIPNWVDVEFIRPLPADNEFRRSFLPAPNSQPPQKLVMFAGNIGLIAGLETVLDAAAALRRRSDIQFLIVGEGSAKAGLVARARQMDLPNVKFLPTQPREILPQVLAAADVHLVTLKRRMSTTSVPSKSYGIMASGRPMVAAVDPGSEVWRLVEEAHAGLCVPPEEPSELAHAIEALCDDAEQRRGMGENARAYVVRHNARHTLTARYEETLQAIARGQGSGARSPERIPDLTPDP
jgi:colanic acid biosynthesis glycosyl transferase WcaI